MSKNGHKFWVPRMVVTHKFDCIFKMERMEQTSKLFFLGSFAYYSRHISGLNIAKRADTFFEESMLGLNITRP